MKESLARPGRYLLAFYLLVLIHLVCDSCTPQTPVKSLGEPAQLDIRPAGINSLRVTLKPISYKKDFPVSPALVNKDFPKPEISIRKLSRTISRKVGNLQVKVQPTPLSILVTNSEGIQIQKITFLEDGQVRFETGEDPILGLGEGGPRRIPGVDWRKERIEFDRRGRLHHMEPRWQSNAYGSRNPVPLLIGTDGWAMYVSSPWGKIDLQNTQGSFIPRVPDEEDCMPQSRENQQQNSGKGLPPCQSMVKGLYDIFIFDAHDPKDLMIDLTKLIGPAKMPPKWALGYMQSHRTLEDETEMIEVVQTFREKKIPLDAVIYLGTEFCPRGWNTYQPSFEFNPEVFKRDPREVIADLHSQNAKVAVHIIPWDRDQLPTLHGSIPPSNEDILDASHIANYWNQHEGVVKAGIDAFWPDEGDWFNLFERIKRHQLYYQGPLSTTPNVRPWSLHRNGYLGIAKWGGWVWSGDTQSSWKTLEGQIAVGLNHSLSISPYWGSDIGGFYPNAEKTGELYARWFQFGAFCPSFRSHGRTWHTALPWGFGLSDMGVREPNRTNDLSEEGALARAPLQESMNDHRIEPITRKYAELRYQLMPYTYTLSWEARESGLPLMRALWLHYPEDRIARGLGDQYLWGRDMLIAPVYKKDATDREVYLPDGVWYDWWNNEKQTGGQRIRREVDLETMPIYVRAGAIIPFDPVRQYTGEPVQEPTTIKIYGGADGAFVLYEDDGISLGYLEGEYSLIKMVWRDEAKSFMIEMDKNTALTGNSRVFKIEMLPDGRSKMVVFNGERVKVDF